MTSIPVEKAVSVVDCTDDVDYVVSVVVGPSVDEARDTVLTVVPPGSLNWSANVVDTFLNEEPHSSGWAFCRFPDCT